MKQVIYKWSNYSRLWIQILRRHYLNTNIYKMFLIQWWERHPVATRGFLPQEALRWTAARVRQCGLRFGKYLTELTLRSEDILPTSWSLKMEHRPCHSSAWNSPGTSHLLHKWQSPYKGLQTPTAPTSYLHWPPSFFPSLPACWDSWNVPGQLLSWPHCISSPPTPADTRSTGPSLPSSLHSQHCLLYPAFLLTLFRTGTSLLLPCFLSTVLTIFYCNNYLF